MNTCVSPFLSLSGLIRGLRGSVGGWQGRGWLSDALAWLLYRRLGEICGRMERLVARFEAGRLWRRGPRASVDAGEARERRVADRRVWPGGFGWLVKLASWQAAGYGSQLRAVLATPEMVALLEAAPQAAVVLRPLCRMLAVETAVLRPGAVDVDVDVAPVDKPKRVRKPRPKVDWGRVPIPRGVLSAVRRRGLVNG